MSVGLRSRSIQIPLQEEGFEIQEVYMQNLKFGKPKMKFIKIPLPRFTKKTRISEGHFNTIKILSKKSQMKTSFYSLQHLIQMTLIFMVLLSPQLIA